MILEGIIWKEIKMWRTRKSKKQAMIFKVDFAKAATSDGLFKGIQIQGSMAISHLFYADDPVFIGEWSDYNLDNIVKILKCFFLASGLKINIQKSQVLDVGVPRNIVNQAASLIGCFDFVSHCKKRVGDGHNTRFWYDSWVFDQPLRVRWICDLNGDGVFRVKEVRTILDDVFLPSAADATIWVKYIPIKINVFAWRARLDHLPTRSNLVRRGVVLDSSLCLLCGLVPEDIHNVLFRCDTAKLVFRRICRWWDLDWHDLLSFSNWNAWFSAIRLPSKIKLILELVFYVAWWHRWVYRNQSIFAATPPRRSVIFDDIVLRSFTWCASRYAEEFMRLASRNQLSEFDAQVARFNNGLRYDIQAIVSLQTTWTIDERVNLAERDKAHSESEDEGLIISPNAVFEDDDDHSEAFLGLVRRLVLTSTKKIENSQRHNIFQTRCKINQDVFNVIVDGGSRTRGRVLFKKGRMMGTTGEKRKKDDSRRNNLERDLRFGEQENLNMIPNGVFRAELRGRIHHPQDEGRKAEMVWSCQEETTNNAELHKVQSQQEVANKSTRAVSKSRKSVDFDLSLHKIKGKISKRSTRAVSKSPKIISDFDSSLHKIKGKKRNPKQNSLAFQGIKSKTEFAYKDQGKILLRGFKNGLGIFVDKCHPEISPSLFEKRAGFGSRKKPYENIFLKTGLSICEKVKNYCSVTDAHCPFMKNV
nr:RNA-directed DNA polymerase, eukaryota [Tanacetum cinerariifolium]